LIPRFPFPPLKTQNTEATNQTILNLKDGEAEKGWVINGGWEMSTVHLKEQNVDKNQKQNAEWPFLWNL